MRLLCSHEHPGVAAIVPGSSPGAPTGRATVPGQDPEDLPTHRAASPFRYRRTSVESPRRDRRTCAVHMSRVARVAETARAPGSVGDTNRSPHLFVGTAGSRVMLRDDGSRSDAYADLRDRIARPDPLRRAVHGLV